MPKLTINNINPSVIKAEYAVRGLISQRSNEIEEDLKDPEKAKKYNFDHVICANTGNPLRFNKNGIQVQFPREVASLLLDHKNLLIDSRTNEETMETLKKLYSETAILTAQKFLLENPKGLGTYTNSQGFLSVRKSIAKFIKARDGYDSDPNNIFITDGASSAIKMILQIFAKSTDPKTGSIVPNAFCVPVPMYPLYSASICLNGSKQLNYYLKEEDNWNLNIKEIEDLFANNENVAGIVIINPGNPSGNVLKYETQYELVNLCSKYGVAIIADEVYQTNVYEQKFTSFKKILSKWSEANPDLDQPMLFSLHSASKGLYGECGLRCGYMECSGQFNEDIFAQIYKMASISLCSNTVGQVVMMAICEGSIPGTPIYKSQEVEKNLVYNQLKTKANIASKLLNQPEKHITCATISGALYAYPRIYLPEKFIAEAKEAKMAPDSYWCLKLLETKGYALVSGSGFTNYPGTFHARLTILNDIDEFEPFIQGIIDFHEEIWNKYK